jgi:hypothetical protein
MSVYNNNCSMFAIARFHKIHERAKTLARLKNLPRLRGPDARHYWTAFHTIPIFRENSDGKKTRATNKCSVRIGVAQSQHCDPRTIGNYRVKATAPHKHSRRRSRGGGRQAANPVFFSAMPPKSCIMDSSVQHAAQGMLTGRTEQIMHTIRRRFWNMKVKIAILTLATFLAMC